MGIFSNNAPIYWNVGLPAMPLLPKQKRPAVNGWQLFADRLPTGEEKDAWLRHYADGNIGIAMGPASGLVAVDIDTDDPKILGILDSILPPSPFRRVGKKGELRVYKYRGERTTRIQTPDEMIVEILSKGTQFVLPPSIHPDTQRPYVANTNLYDVIDQIPYLIMGIEDLIRDALMDAGYQVGKANTNKVMDYVPAGQRDNKMVWHAGLLARAVTRGERTLLEALGEMQEWVETKVEQVVNDPVTVEKAQKKVIEFIQRDINGVRKMALPVGWDEGLTGEDTTKLGLTITEDDEKWSAAQIIQKIASDFQEYDDLHSNELHDAIQANLQRVARSEGEITTLDEGRILKFISVQSGGLMSLPDLRRQLRELKIGEIKGENHDEIAVAVKNHIDAYGELRFHAGKFWQWQGSHWGEKPPHELIQVISSEFGFYPSCRKNSDYNGILKLMESKCAKDLRQVFIKGVNFANGYLDEDLILRDHHADYGATYVLPYRYVRDEAGKMPLFNQFMVDSWGHDPDFNDKVAVFQEMIGATLFSVAPRYQKAFCFYGAAGSGKSVASRVFRDLLPKNSISAVAPTDWHDRFLPAEMYGKLLNFAGELSEDKRISGEIFKQIVEAESITAQHKNQQPFVYQPGCAQLFNSNHLPVSRDHSMGFTRRWLFVEWNREVPEEERDPLLAQKIAAEKEAIAAWAVEGYRRLRENGRYTLPASHHRLVDQMLQKINSVANFLTKCENLIVGAAAVSSSGRPNVTVKDLYSEYRFYKSCHILNVPTMDTASFESALISLATKYGYQVDTSTEPAVVIGIALAS